MHNTNIHPLGRNSFCYCPFSTLAAAVFHLKLVRGGVWGLVCQLVMWLSGMGDCLSPMPWAPADQMLNGLGKMIGKCCAFAFRIVSSRKEIHLPTQISRALSFSAKQVSLLWHKLPKWEKSGVENLHTNQENGLSWAQLSLVSVTLLYSIWLQNCPWISHGTKELNIYQVSPEPNLKTCL